MESFVKHRPAPPDWVYVHNFDDPDRPRAIRLPAGRGRQLAAALDRRQPEGRQPRNQLGHGQVRECLLLIEGAIRNFVLRGGATEDAITEGPPRPGTDGPRTGRWRC